MITEIQRFPNNNPDPILKFDDGKELTVEFEYIDLIGLEEGQEHTYQGVLDLIEGAKEGK